MKTETVLVRDPGDRDLTPSVFVKEASVRGGQRARYRLRLRSKRDVAAARRAGLAISLLESAAIAALGYPLSFKPKILVGATEAPTILKSTFKPIVFKDGQAARTPTLEDTVVAMLAIDPLGARRIAVENRQRLDTARLLKRILSENKERLAYRVRLDDFAPGLRAPEGIAPISRGALRREDHREFARRA